MIRKSAVTTLVGWFAFSIAASAGDASSQVMFSIDGGGGYAAGGAYRMQATAGQSDAGMLTGGRFVLRGGMPTALSDEALFSNSFEESSP